MRSLLCLSLSAALLLAGCGDDQAPETSSNGAAPSARSGASAPSFFDRIDADTPYLFANLERSPEELVDAMWAINDASAESNQAMMNALAEDEEVPAEARALINEFMSLSTREGWEAAGLHVNPMYALHGISVFPVIHMELADSEAFRAKIASVEAQLGEELTRRDIEGESIIWATEDDMPIGLAVHIGDDLVTVGLVPDQPAVLSRLVGATAPVDPIDAGSLDDFNASLGFTPHGSGYIDWQRLLARVIGPDPVLAAIDVDGALDKFRNDPACPAEFQALTTAMPRLVTGYTRLDEEQADFMMRQETSRAIGEGLAPIARAPVSIDRELNGLMNFGLAVDLIAAREFARGLVNGWVENPPGCAAFSAIAQQAPQMQDMLNRPIPPVVTNVKGLFLEANRLEMGEGGLPTGGGTLSFFMKDPQLLVGMAQMFSPQVAELSLEPGGEPQKVPMEAIPQLQGTGLEAWMAMSKSAIGMAIGEDQIDALVDGLDEDAADGFVLAGRMDFDILVDLMDFATQGVQAEGADPQAVQMLEAQRAQYERMAEYYDQVSGKMGLSEAGIDFVFEARFED